MGNYDYGQGEGTLKKAAGIVDDYEKRLNTLTDRLSGQISNMKGWQGAGGRAFDILQAAWTEKQKMLNRALQDFRDSLNQTEQINVSNDQAQETSMRSLENSLGSLPGR